MDGTFIQSINLAVLGYIIGHLFWISNRLGKLEGKICILLEERREKR